MAFLDATVYPPWALDVTDIILKGDAMINSDKNNPIWAKSSLCANTDCVEVALIHQQVLVRSSKNTAGPILRFDLREWATFLSAVRDGEFDVP